MLLWNRADVWWSIQRGRRSARLWGTLLHATIVWSTEERMEHVSPIYLLFKDESHGERDSLEQQQHTENTEELQRGNQERSQSPRTDVNVQL